MLNSKFKARFYRLGALALLISLSFSCLTLHSYAEDTTQDTTTAQHIKVELLVEDKPLDLDISAISYLNFTATVSRISPDAKISQTNDFSIPQEDLVKLILPVSTDEFEKDANLKANEFEFVAKRPSSWLLNLQIKGYNLIKSAFDANKQLLQLTYKAVNADATQQVAYFTGGLNCIQTKGELNFKTIRKNLMGILQAAGLETSNAPVYNLLDGKVINNLSGEPTLLGLANEKAQVAPDKQTLSYTPIYKGKIVKDADIYNLPLIQTNQANVYNKSANAATKANNATIVAKADLASANTNVGQSNQKGKKQSKYKTTVISPNNTSIVPSTGETAVSISLSMLCFISATALYAVKRRMR